jgi:hypothetical protein
MIEEQKVDHFTAKKTLRLVAIIVCSLLHKSVERILNCGGAPN